MPDKSNPLGWWELWVAMGTLIMLIVMAAAIRSIELSACGAKCRSKPVDICDSAMNLVVCAGETQIRTFHGEGR